MNRTCRTLLCASLLSIGQIAVASEPEHPKLSVTTLDGKTFELAQQKGSWVIVNFWATWCAPCIKELPDISRFVTGHSNVKAIGLAWEDTDKEEVLAFLKQHPVSFPMAQLDIYDPPAAFATPRGLPTTYLIAPDGRIAHHYTGPVTEVDLEKAINAESAPAPAASKSKQ